MERKERNSFAKVSTLVMMSTISLLLLYLGQQSPANQADNDQSTNVTMQETVDSTQVVNVSMEPTPEQQTVDIRHIEHLTHQLSERQLTELFTELQAIAPDYQSDILRAQPSIQQAIQSISGNVEELGYLFLPEKPAEIAQLSQVKQLDVPLKLQKDPKWRSIKYGDDTTGELGENGCAIVSLAMIHDYYSDQSVTPQDILKWSREDFYLHNQGTSWNIFHNFANQFGYGFYNHGDNFQSAMAALNKGEVVVASVKPGLFTDFGHILVVRGYQDGLVYVNDPNDDPSKMFSIQGIDQNVFENEAINYWSFSKEG